MVCKCTLHNAITCVITASECYRLTWIRMMFSKQGSTTLNTLSMWVTCAWATRLLELEIVKWLHNWLISNWYKGRGSKHYDRPATLHQPHLLYDASVNEVLFAYPLAAMCSKVWPHAVWGWSKVPCWPALTVWDKRIGSFLQQQHDYLINQNKYDSTAGNF